MTEWRYGDAGGNGSGIFIGTAGLVELAQRAGFRGSMRRISGGLSGGNRHAGRSFSTDEIYCVCAGGWDAALTGTSDAGHMRRDLTRRELELGPEAVRAIESLAV